MPTDPLSGWKDTYKKLPNSKSQPDGVMNFTNWIDGHISSKLGLDPSAVGGPPAMFTWVSASFSSVLISAAPLPIPITLALAWQAGALASIASMIVPSGSFVGSPAPATTFSAPPLALIDPASIVLGFTSLLASLTALSPVSDPDQVKIPDLMRTAFLSLTVSLIGLNSLPIPTPLLAPLTPVK